MKTPPEDKTLFSPDLPAVTRVQALQRVLNAMIDAAAYFEILEDDVSESDFRQLMEVMSPKNPFAIEPAVGWFRAINQEYLNDA